MSIRSHQKLSFSGKFRISSSLVESFFGLAEVTHLERTFIICLISVSITSVVKVPLNTVFVNSLSLLLFTFIHVKSVTSVLHLFVQTMIVLLSSSVITQSGGAKIEIGLAKIRSIGSCILTISMLINGVSLGGGGLVAESWLGALTDGKVRFALLLLHKSVSLLSVSGDGGLSSSGSIHSE